MFSSARRAAVVFAFCVTLGFLAGGRAALAQGYGGTVSDMLTRGQSLLAQNRPNEAMAQFQDARTLCATPAEIVTSLMGEAQSHLASKEYLPGAGLLEEAAQRFPDDPRMADVLYLAGMARKMGGDLPGAAPLLQRALDSKPTPDMLPNIKFRLGEALRLTGKAADVPPLLKDFETEFPLHHLIPNALYLVAIAQHDSGKLTESEATYKHLIEAFPHSQAAAEAFYDLGAVLADNGKKAEAAEFFRRYANGNPSSSIAARAMERAGDLTLLHSPSEALLYYGVAQAKAVANPAPPTPDMAVSGWLGTKRNIADALSRAWVLAIAGAVALLILAWTARKFLRRGRAVA
jgi:TolA-binding protein